MSNNRIFMLTGKKTKINRSVLHSAREIEKRISGLVVAIVGPTSSGKTDLAIRLARVFNGEIVSADSRQVYRGMDLGTGKTIRDRITNNELRTTGKKNSYISGGIVHHLLDVASPKRQFGVAQYQKLAEHAVRDILKREKLPIICGGTGQYVDAVMYNMQFPHIKPDPKLRRMLQQKSVDELYRMLRARDPVRASSIDRKNPRRLIRALEIVLSTNKPVPHATARAPRFERSLWLGLDPSRQVLKARIAKRLKVRIRQGMLEEVRRLRKAGVSSRQLDAFGLDYRYANLCVEGKISRPAMEERILRENCKYAKRQMTWWKRNKDILWISGIQEAKKLLKKFALCRSLP
jgi:tRNA dimethylallyltransferase